MCMRDTCTLYTNVCLCVRAGIQLHREALGPVSISTGRDVPRKQSVERVLDGAGQWEIGDGHDSAWGGWASSPVLMRELK